MFVLALLSLFLATTGSAAPHHHGRDTGISGSALQAVLPSDATLSLPTSNANFLALGCGVQNYTCTGAGNYSSIGALANLYDISQLFNTAEFANVTNCGLEIWSGDQGETNPFNSGLDSLIQNNLGLNNKLGEHFFTNFNGTSEPEFDFTQSQGNAGDFTIDVKSADIPSPTDPTNSVDWLALSNVSGILASQTFRIFTAGGKQPSSCQPGSGDISVKYCAQYWFFP